MTALEQGWTEIQKTFSSREIDQMICIGPTLADIGPQTQQPGIVLASNYAHLSPDPALPNALRSKLEGLTYSQAWSLMEEIEHRWKHTEDVKKENAKNVRESPTTVLHTET